MRHVQYDSGFYARADSWPLDFAVQVVAANGMSERRVNFSIFDEQLSLEELQATHSTRLWYLVEHAILAGEMEVVVGPVMKPDEPAEILNMRITENGGSMEVRTPACGYSFLDIFDDPNMHPVQKPRVLQASVQDATERYVKRRAYCAWVKAKGYHVPTDLQDEGKSEGEKMTSSADPDKSRNVMVVHGRNEAIRDGMFDFLRAFGVNSHRMGFCHSRHW